MTNTKFNLPVMISEWQVRFRPLPFMKKRGTRHYLATNLMETSTSFTNESMDQYKKQRYDYTLPVCTEYDIEEYGTDMLRNYYIHKKKSWSFPEIEKVDEYIVYLPYEIEETDDKIFLLEEMTGLKRKIKRNDKIYETLKGDGCR